MQQCQNFFTTSECSH